MKGCGVSEGVAVGKLFLYKPYVPEVCRVSLSEEAVAVELETYRAAANLARQELMNIKDTFSAIDSEKSMIFDAHLEILEDEAMEEEILEAISRQQSCAQSAVADVYDSYKQILSSSDNPMFRERAVDLSDVRNRLLRCLQGVPEKNLSQLPEPVIIAAQDILPSEMATLDWKNVLGIVTRFGGITSHTAILARSYAVPAVLGVSALTDEIAENSDIIVVDVTENAVILSPSEAVRLRYEEKRKYWQAQKQESLLFLDRKAMTRDGCRVEIGLNIGSDAPEELDALRYTDYVGLFRTEFLFMERSHIPTEEEQFLAYRAVLEAAEQKPVTIRTLDIGGDKQLSYLPLPHEENPFLGNRALRLCFDHPDLFISQLRALLRASVYGNLWIMLPMVGSLDDIRRSKKLIQCVKEQLRAEKMPVSDNVRFGIMIEIPSIALLADKVVEEVDFASIGTNDLCQYLMAADRMNPQVSQYYQSHNPAMYRLIGHVAEVFSRAGKPLSICGELGGDPTAISILIGLGVGKISMSDSAVARAKQTISQWSMDEMIRLATRVKDCETAQQVIGLGCN